jgi:predicted glycoside hydrolase/deacetylase ChbG (UPF0249 family)
MRLRNWAVFLLCLAAAGAARGQSKTVAERLGYPADSKLLILHADDLAVAHSVDAASFDALNKNAVSSASIMVPCAWFTEVASYAKEHPDADLGLHLTLTSEWKVDRWGPMESKDKVMSLLDPNGYLWPETPKAVQNEKPEEVEREIRAQVEHAIAMGIRPTHLDSHMAVLFSKPGAVRHVRQSGARIQTTFSGLENTQCSSTDVGSIQQRRHSRRYRHSESNGSRKRMPRLLCQCNQEFEAGTHGNHRSPGA